MKTIANYSVTMDLLKRYERRAKKHFGQNFLIDPSVVRNIAAHSGTGSTVIEVGPGLGALTQQLSFNYDQVIAYEIDHHMVEILNESLEGIDNVEVILQDFLKADLSMYTEKVAVCANLPYYITTPLLFKLMELDVINMTLMVQKEIGDRLCAQPKTKDYSSLTIMMQYYYDIETVMHVSKESFNPRPNVESIIIQLTPREHSLPYDETKFFEFVRSCFQFRRKTLNNNLKTLELDLDYPAILESIGINPAIRADYLSFDDYVKLYGAIYA